VACDVGLLKLMMLSSSFIWVGLSIPCLLFLFSCFVLVYRCSLLFGLILFGWFLFAASFRHVEEVVCKQRLLCL
jgi:hypothetical protein